MEESSLLKIRSDLYPLAERPQNNMNSNTTNITMSPNVPSNPLSASTATTVSNLAQNLTSSAVPTYKRSSPVPVTESQSIDVISHNDEPKPEDDSTLRHSNLESSPSHLQEWKNTSKTDISAEEPVSPTQMKMHAREMPSVEECQRHPEDSSHDVPYEERGELHAPERGTSPHGRLFPTLHQRVAYHFHSHPNPPSSVALEEDPSSRSSEHHFSAKDPRPPHPKADDIGPHSSGKEDEEEEEEEEEEEVTLDLSMSSSRSARDTPITKGASPPPSFNPFGVFPGLAARLGEMGPVFEQGTSTSASPIYPPNLPPQLFPWLISSHIQNLVHHHQVNRSEMNRGSLFENCNGRILMEDKEPEPLDLSAKKQDAKVLTDEDLVARVLEVKPSTRGRRRADNSKRSYTDFELHAALREIQSGKLGTRKAAVKYGIPRSTLRNKVYKLQLVRDSNKANLDQKDKLCSILPDSTAGSHSPLIQNKPLESGNQVDIPCEALKTIIRKKMTEKLEELSRNNQTYLSGGDKQKLLDSALMYLCENVPKLALNTDNKTTPSEILSSLSLYPQLQDFTHKIVEERFYEEIKKINNNTSDPNFPEVTNGYSYEPGTSPISIPSYQSTYKCPSDNSSTRNEEIRSESSHPSISSPQANLKDMIAQIINQKILSDEATSELSAPNSSAQFLPLPVQTMDPSFLKTNLKLQSDEKSQQDQTKKRAKSPSTGGGKGSRPKRGKYRNYDRDNLLKAVQAVQSGEMSVHRAGSFYGVPHSTLEYKVKERHLNRGKNKKDATAVTNNPLFKSEKENSTVSSVLASSVFSREYKTDTPDTTTKDFSSADNRANDEISIISVQSSPVKKPKMCSDQEEQFPSIPLTPNPFLSNPFPFWNNASPILAPFLSSPYQADPLYASQVMSNFQRVASKFSGSDSRNNSPSPNNSEPKAPENYSSEGVSKTHGLFSNGGSVSSTPPSSPPIHDGLLNTFLRKKMESQMGETSLPWQVNNEGCSEPKEQKSELDPSGTPQAGLLTLKALLPSFIAARTSMAAALSPDNSNPNDSRLSTSSPQSVNPVPLLKRSPHRPIIGGALSESP